MTELLLIVVLTLPQLNFFAFLLTSALVGSLFSFRLKTFRGLLSTFPKVFSINAFDIGTKFLG